MLVYYSGEGRWLEASYSSDELNDLLDVDEEHCKESNIFRLSDRDALELEFKRCVTVTTLYPSRHPRWLGKRREAYDLERCTACCFNLDEPYIFTTDDIVLEPSLTEPTSLKGGAGSQDDTLNNNQQRNKIAQEWIKETNPVLEGMTNQQKLDALMLYNPNDKRLFMSGGKDWLNRDHSVIPKGKPGLRPGK